MMGRVGGKGCLDARRGCHTPSARHPAVELGGKQGKRAHQAARRAGRRAREARGSPGGRIWNSCWQKTLKNCWKRSSKVSSMVRHATWPVVIVCVLCVCVIVCVCVMCVLSV